MMRFRAATRGLCITLVLLLPGACSAPARATAPSPEAGAAPAAGPAPAAYRIGPQDVLHVSVWQNLEMTQDVVVRPDGKISLPLIQDVRAEGLTAAELAQVIQQKLTPYIKDPTVTVIVKEVNAPKIFVTGYVAKPGEYPLRGDLSVLQALAMAGGLTPFASPKKIRIIRNEGGKQETRVVNYYDLINSGEGNYLLRSGDTVVVP